MNKNEQNNPDKPNYAARRAIAGVALVSAAAGGFFGIKEAIQPAKESTPISVDIEDSADPSIIEINDITLERGDRIIDVATEKMSELRHIPENEISQDISARAIKETKADTLPKITQPGDTLTVRYDPNSDSYDIDVHTK